MHRKGKKNIMKKVQMLKIQDFTRKAADID